MTVLKLWKEGKKIQYSVFNSFSYLNNKVAYFCILPKLERKDTFTEKKKRIENTMYCHENGFTKQPGIAPHHEALLMP